MSNVTGPTNFDVCRVGGAPEDPESVRYGLVSSAPAPSADEVETAQRALEVIVMWGDNAVLYVEHLSPIRSYYVVEPGGSDCIPVVIDAGGAPAVVIPAGATGEVSDDSGQHDLRSLIGSGRAQPCAELAGAHQYLLGAGASARVVYRELSFTVRLVQAGRAVGRGPGPFDAKRSAWTLASFSIHALFLLAMYLMPPGSAALSLELLSDDARRAAYLMQPPEASDEQTPGWLSSADDAGGDGKRHDGDGQMGTPQSKPAKRRYGIAAPHDNQDPHMARDIAREQAKAAGILGVLTRSTGAWNAPSSPFGEKRAVGYDPMTALGALMGEQIGENFGFGRLGMRGTGRGGGGDGKGTIGAGKLGTIGHGAGGGSGSHYGRGKGGFRSHLGQVPLIRYGEPDVRGSLSKEVIRRVIQRHINEVRFCYEQQLSAQHDLAGRVQVKFVITPSGAVQMASVEKSTLGAARAERCIEQAVRRWAFPAPEGGGVVIVSYPFMFEAAGD